MGRLLTMAASGGRGVGVGSGVGVTVGVMVGGAVVGGCGVPSVIDGPGSDSSPAGSLWQATDPKSTSRAASVSRMGRRIGPDYIARVRADQQPPGTSN